MGGPSGFPSLVLPLKSRLDYDEPYCQGHSTQYAMYLVPVCDSKFVAALDLLDLSSASDMTTVITAVYYVVYSICRYIIA